MADGFDVDTEELTRASSAIKDTVSGAEGIQLESLTGDSESFGHNGVFESIGKFCTTWQAAVTLLAQQSGSLGDALDGAAGTYAQQESDTAGELGGVESLLPPAGGPSQV